MTSAQADRPTRIIIADDQTAVRDGLAIMLDLLPDITVLGAAANGLEAIELVDAHRPDVALIDLHMPVLDGIETTRRLTAEHPEVAIVILTTLADDASIIGALECRSARLPDEGRWAERHRPRRYTRRRAANPFSTTTSKPLSCGRPTTAPKLRRPSSSHSLTA